MNNSPRPPRAYAEWLPVLDRFANGDDEALHELAMGEAPWTSGVAQRWANQVVYALDTRLRALSDSLQKALRRAVCHDDQARALIAARRRLTALQSFTALACMPEEVRVRLQDELDRWRTNTQNSLEQSAQSVRGDDGRLLKVIKDNNLTRSAVEPDGLAPAPLEGTGRGRRVLL